MFDVVTLQSFSIVFTIVPWSIYIVFVRLFGVSLEMFQWKARVFTTVTWMCMSSDKHINDWFPAFISIHIGISWLYKTILAMSILICSVDYSSVIARIFEKCKNHIHIYSNTFCWNHTVCLLNVYGGLLHFNIQQRTISPSKFAFPLPSSFLAFIKLMCIGK